MKAVWRGVSVWWVFGVCRLAVAALAEPLAVGTTAIRLLPQIESVTVWERTGGTGPAGFNFPIGDARLSARRADLLNASNCDFSRTTQEYFDIFFSGADGSPDPEGAYLTVEALFSASGVPGAGMNIAEVQLHFTGGKTESGLTVASYVTLGAEGVPSSVGACVDGNILTHTAMGRTSGASPRMRITIGFLSSSGPPVPLPARIGGVSIKTGQATLEVLDLVSAVSNRVETAPSPVAGSWDALGWFVSHHGSYTCVVPVAGDERTRVYRVRSRWIDR